MLQKHTCPGPRAQVHALLIALSHLPEHADGRQLSLGKTRNQKAAFFEAYSGMSPEKDIECVMGFLVKMSLKKKISKNDR